MKRLLLLKHWQLFCLLLVLPLLLQIIIIALALSGKDPVHALVFFPFVMISFIAVFFGWFYTLGTGLQNKLPLAIHMNIDRFKILLAVPVFYLSLFCVFIFYLVNGIAAGNEPNLWIFMVIVPLHLFSIFCIFYCMYFVAKALKTVELQKAVAFSDFAGEFALIWIFPIGIWILQPRINKLFSASVNE